MGNDASASSSAQPIGKEAAAMNKAATRSNYVWLRK